MWQQFHSWVHIQKLKVGLNRYLYIHIHSRVIDSSQKVETTRMHQLMNN